MSETEIDWDGIAAVLERAAGCLAAERALETARQLREAAHAAGQVTWRPAALSAHYGLDVAAFQVHDPADGWDAEVCVIPAGLAGVITGAIHESRERLAAELLGRLRKVARPDGTWPAGAMTEVVEAWLLDHGADAGNHA